MIDPREEMGARWDSYMLSRRVFAFLLGGLVAPNTAFAQQAPSPEEIAARRTLLEQAQAASESNDHTTAARLAAQALRIQSTPSVRLFLAREEQSIGRFASAAGNAESCGQEAERTPNVPNREALIASCRELAVAIRSQSGQVQLTLPEGAPEPSRVTLDGVVIATTLLSVPVLAHPGEVRIEATTEGRAPWSRVVVVRRGETTSVELYSGSSAPPPATPSPPIQTPQPPTTQPTQSFSLRFAAPWIMGLGGGVGAALGVGFLVGSELEVAGCEAPTMVPWRTGLVTPCPYPDAAARVSTSNALAGASVAGFVVAGAAVTTGAVLYALSPRRAPSETHATPALAWIPNGVALSGAF